MIRKNLLATVLLFALQMPSKAQVSTLDGYANKMLFNVFTEPDAEIREFVALYIPSLLNKTSTKPAGKRQSFESHAFLFMKHPFVTFNFTNGRLVFDCRRFGEKDVRVEKTTLILTFNAQQEAELAYGEIVQALKPISTKNRIRTENGGFAGEFEDENIKTGFNKIEVFLTTDIADKGKYVLLFMPGKI